MVPAGNGGALDARLQGDCMASRNHRIDRIWSSVEGIKKPESRTASLAEVGSVRLTPPPPLTWVPVVGTAYMPGAGWLLYQAHQARRDAGHDRKDGRLSGLRHGHRRGAPQW
jgi:hypothetical protein